MYLDDAVVGQEFDIGPRTITPEDLRAFATLTWDRNPIHVDPEFAKTTPFGRPVAHGMLTLSLALGLWSDKGYTRESLVALVGLSDVRFLKPVYPGDAIRLLSKIAEVRESRTHPGTGFVTYQDRVVNNSQEVVAEFRRTVLLKKRTPVASPESKAHESSHANVP